MSNKYVDYKATVWCRVHFNDEADMQEIIKTIKEGGGPYDITDEEMGFSEFEVIHETETYITPEEYDGYHTIEVYDETIPDQPLYSPIWTNKPEQSELKKKTISGKEAVRLIKEAEAVIVDGSMLCYPNVDNDNEEYCKVHTWVESDGLTYEWIFVIHDDDIIAVDKNALMLRETISGELTSVFLLQIQSL